MDQNRSALDFINKVTPQNTELIKNEIIKEIDQVEKIHDEDVYSLKKTKIFEMLKHFIFNRLNFNYGYWDVIQYFIWWLCIRKKIKVIKIWILNVTMCLNLIANYINIRLYTWCYIYLILRYTIKYHV